MRSLNSVERSCIFGLARAVVPIEEWLSGRARGPVAPWRALGVATLTLEDLRFDRFVEAALNGEFEADEAADAVQWNAAITKPTKKFPAAALGPHPSYAAWRAAVLSPVAPEADPPVFGLTDFDGGEVIVPGPNPPASARFSTRERVYDLGLRALVTLAPSGPPTGGWPLFASRMAQDRAWTAASYSDLGSAAFLKLFVKDLLRCVLGMRTEGAVDPRQSALLAELGERRRVGNAYSVEDVERARAAFAAALGLALP
jgi:hypothetical protein